MPYILLKRSDVPEGLLQTLDLKPSESLRLAPYQPVGQTGYVRPIDNASVSFSSDTFHAQATGLTAWLLCNVSSGSGAKATAAITTVAAASIVDGDYFTLCDGVNTVVFGFKKTASYAVPATRVTLDITGATTAANVRDVIIPAVNNSVLDVTAVSGGAATVSLTNDNQNISAALQNNTNNSENVANVGFAVTDFAGAAASTALSAAQAATSATNIMTRVTNGSTLNFSGLNTAVTVGYVTKAQVTDVLDLLSGRRWVVASGQDVVGLDGNYATGTGSFASSSAYPIRRVYDTEAFRLSLGSGRLSLLASSSFSYAGVTGAAIAVYNDDGTPYTV